MKIVKTHKPTRRPPMNYRKDNYERAVAKMFENERMIVAEYGSLENAPEEALSFQRMLIDTVSQRWLEMSANDQSEYSL
jgi:Lon protease-like protein